MKKIYLGTMGIPHEKMEESIKNALDAGYYGIDTAWRYKNELVVGKAIKNLKSKGYKNIKIQSKIWPDFFDDPMAILTKQLKELQVQKVDSLLLHRPSGDFKKSIAAWKKIIEMKKAGLADQIGVSNFDKDMIDALVRVTGVVPESNQIELSITNFREDRYQYGVENNIEIQAWSPMGKDIKKMLAIKDVVSLAKKYKVTPATIAISYLSSQNIVPVLKSATKSHIYEMENLVELTIAELEILKKHNKYENKYSETYSFQNIFK